MLCFIIFFLGKSLCVASVLYNLSLTEEKKNPMHFFLLIGNAASKFNNFMYM